MAYAKNRHDNMAVKRPEECPTVGQKGIFLTWSVEWGGCAQRRAHENPMIREHVFNSDNIRKTVYTRIIIFIMELIGVHTTI